MTHDDQERALPAAKKIRGAGDSGFAQSLLKVRSRRVGSCVADHNYGRFATAGVGCRSDRAALEGGIVRLLRPRIASSKRGIYPGDSRTPERWFTGWQRAF